MPGDIYRLLLLMLALLGALCLAGLLYLLDAAPSASLYALRDSTLSVGLSAAGLVMAAAARPDDRLPQRQALAWLVRVWLFVAWVPLPGLQASLSLAAVALALCATAQQDALRVIWAGGMLAASAAGLALGVDPGGNLEAVLRLARLWLGWLPASMALAFWLLWRISEYSAAWAGQGGRVVCGASLLAGVAVTLAPLGLAAPLRAAAACLPLLAAALLGGRAYAALSRPNAGRALTAHWVAFAVLLLLASVGVGGSLRAAAGAIDSPFIALPGALLSAAIIGLLLALLHQTGAEQRGQNRRIGGLMPFWGAVIGLAGMLAAWLALGGALLIHADLQTPELAPVRALMIGCAALLMLSWGLLVQGVLRRGPRLRGPGGR